MIKLFEPIFIYQLVGFSITWVAAFYGIQNLIAFFLRPLGAKMAARFGFEKTITLSLPIQVFYLALLAFAKDWEALVYVLPVISALYLSIYWPAFHANFAHYGNAEIRGKQYSTLNSMNDVLSIIAPIVGGVLITVFSFEVLFVTASIVILLSCIPMLSTREKFVPSHFSYWRAISRIYRSYKTYSHRYFLTYVGMGVDAITLIIWPIFISIVLIDNFSLMGFLNGGIALLTAFYTIYIGSAYDKYSDDRNRGSYLTSLIVYSVIFPLRALVSNWWHIFLFRSVSSISGRNIGMGANFIMYQKAGVHGNLKYVVFFLQSLNLGRLILFLAIFLWGYFLGISYQQIFLIGAFWSLLMGVMWFKKSD